MQKPQIETTVIFLSFLLMAGPAYAETNLDAAWKACTAAAESVTEMGDFEQADWWLDYTWSDDLSALCHQIQDMKMREAKADWDAKQKRWQEEWRADRIAKTKAAIPLVQRALDDPLGGTK